MKTRKYITDHGYVRMNMPKDHPAAFRNQCWGYEHIYVATEMFGRPLNNGETVHHINGIRTDNRPENLLVVSSQAEHQYYHRLDGCNRRCPDEDNPTIQCACGCGMELLKYDEDGRPRTRIYRHWNGMKLRTRNKILTILEDHPCRAREINERMGADVYTTLSYLTKIGVINRIGHGMYSIPYKIKETLYR